MAQCDGFQKHPENINRNGAPKKNNSMRAILEEIGKELEIIKDKEGKDLKLTKKQLLAKQMFIQALKGNFNFVKLVTAYTDGEPEKNVNVKKENIEPDENEIDEKIKNYLKDHGYTKK